MGGGRDLLYLRPVRDLAQIHSKKLTPAPDHSPEENVGYKPSTISSWDQDPTVELSPIPRAARAPRGRVPTDHAANATGAPLAPGAGNSPVR